VCGKTVANIANKIDDEMPSYLFKTAKKGVRLYHAENVSI
jgi:hypothetical protein